MNLNFDRIPLWGISAVILSALPALFLCTEEYPPVSTAKSIVSPKQTPISTDFTLPLSNTLSVLSVDSEAAQINYSIDPPRPSSTTAHSRLLIRLSQTKQTKRVDLPARIGVEFNNQGALQFADNGDQFWLTCDLLESGMVEASLFLKTPTGYEQCKANCSRSPQETPIFSTEEIPVTSPFRTLAESRFWGQDLFAEKFGNRAPLERIEMGIEPNQTLLEFGSDQWLVFKEGKWTVAALDEQLPIARVTGHSSQSLEMEGWEGSSHIRFKIPQNAAIPLRTKGEELFSQLRIRSEKQVSCIIDKQCLIIRAGDWVLKANNRWKILRKKEEKEAFLAGKIVGDLFVLERIDAKGAVKSIGGWLFSPKRSQSASIEFTQPVKKERGR